MVLYVQQYAFKPGPVYAIYPENSVNNPKM